VILQVNVMQEISLYGLSNFIADFGGYLGLLLGASLITIYEEIVSVIKSMLFLM
jgi:hypothetical protein